MVTIIIDVPDEFAPEVFRAVALRNGWLERVPDPERPGEMIDNPVTAQFFTEEHLAAQLRDAYKLEVAERAAREAKQKALGDHSRSSLIGVRREEEA